MNDATQMNGNEAPKAAAPAQPTVEQAKAALEQYLSAVVGTTVRGTIASLQNIPPPVLLVALTKVMASELGRIWGGEAEEVTKFRNILRKTFSETLHQAPINAPPKPAEQKPAAQASEPLPVESLVESDSAKAA